MKVLYLLDTMKEQVHILEVDELELSNNIENFIENIIYCGFNNFILYNNYCNCGLCGEIAEVKNCEIELKMEIGGF